MRITSSIIITDDVATGDVPTAFKQTDRMNLPGATLSSRSNGSLPSCALVVLLCGVVGLLGGCAESGPPAPIGTITPSGVKLGDVAPDFALPGPNGDTVRLSDYRGKVVYIDFWASWCGPCLAVLPDLKQIWVDYQDRDFVIIGVSLDIREADWREFIASNGMEWPHVFEPLVDDPKTPKGLYGVTGIPNTFLIDTNGVVVGENLHGELLRLAIEEYL